MYVIVKLGLLCNPDYDGFKANFKVYCILD